MKIKELLWEYDANKVNTLASKLSTRAKDNSLPKNKSIIELADIIEQQYDVRSGEYVFWLLNRYVNDKISRWEDIGSRAIPAIEKFDLLKKKPKLNPPLPTKDLNQIRSLSDLEDIVEKYQEKDLASQTEKASAEEQNFYDSKQAILLHNGPQIKVVIPKTKEASMYFGRNTRWCTAATKNNQFNSYNDEGPLYIVLIKSKNERYQFHFEDEQFMNEKDEPINPNNLADQYPILWKIFTPVAKKNNTFALYYNPPIDLQLAAIKQNWRAIEYIKNPSKEVQSAAIEENLDAILYIENPSEEIQLAAVKQDGTAIFDIKNPSEKVKLAAVNQDGNAIKYIENPSEEVQMAAVKQDGTAIHFIKNPTLKVIALANRKIFRKIT